VHIVRRDAAESLGILKQCVGFTALLAARGFPMPAYLNFAIAARTV